jgi:hypothetical protein
VNQNPPVSSSRAWDNLGCLAVYTLFGWGFIAACVHDWFFGTNRAG